MNMIRFVLVGLLLFSVSAYAKDPSAVEIQKVDGHNEAIVSDFDAPREKPTGWFGKTCYYIEGGILTTARTTSAVVGKVTDTTVWGVQKTSNVIISPIVKALDVRTWFRKKTAVREGR